MEKFKQLVTIMQKLRDPNDGCPWDIEQTHESIGKYVIEEAYEVLDAIDRKDTENLKEELGDLLLQVVFHAQMAKDQGTFSIEDVIDGINAKMITRHPHVFGDKQSLSPDEVQAQWDEIKDKDKKGHLLSSVPASLPAMMKSYEIGKKCTKVGFDWKTLEQIKAKMDEEWQELQEGIAKNDQPNIEEELGDFMFVTAQYVRKMGLNPEIVLQKANDKFTKRISLVESFAKQDDKNMQDCSSEELEAYWERSKKA